MTVEYITDPTVRVLHSSVMWDSKWPSDWDFPRSPDTMVNLITVAGKTCYDSFGGNSRPARDHVEALIRQGHGSVLEHATVGLHISGVSRDLTHELVRHRVGMAYSQRSTRFVNESAVPQIVLEPWMVRIHNAVKAGTQTSEEAHVWLIFDTAMRASFGVYGVILKYSRSNNVKLDRGRARQVLPGCLATELVVTGNLRAWRHFIETRSAPGAEPEIRRLTEQVYRVLARTCPTAFHDMKESMAEGYPHYTTEYRKV